jgi:hypothetical protein
MVKVKDGTQMLAAMAELEPQRCLGSFVAVTLADSFNTGRATLVLAGATDQKVLVA